MSLEQWQKAQTEMAQFNVGLPPVLLDDDFRALKGALRGCSHDDGRESVINSMDPNTLVTADQVGAFLRAYSHDDGREHCLEVLGPRVANPKGLRQYTGTMSHDDGRTVLLKWSSGPDLLDIPKTSAPGTRGTHIPSFTVGVLAGLLLAGLLFAVLG